MLVEPSSGLGFEELSEAELEVMGVLGLGVFSILLRIEIEV
jgi:hypothetical protein